MLASKKLFLFVFSFDFSSHSRIFHSHGHVTIALWRPANIDLCSAFMAIEQWGFSNVPHLLWHGASVYNSHLQWPVPVTPIAQRLAVELLLPVFYDICLSWVGFEHPTLRLRGECSYPLRHRRGQICSLSGRVKINYLS